MIVFDILIVLLCILIFLLLIILVIPFGYKIKAVSLEDKRAEFNAFWLFGLIGFSGEYVLNQGFESKINIFGIKKSFDKADESKSEGVKKEKKEKKGKKEFSIEAARHIFTSIKRVIKYILPNKVEGYGRIGFDDPYYTGIVCAFIESMRGLHIHNLNLDYVFDSEVYEGEIYVEGRIILIYIVYIAFKLLLNKSARKLIFN